MTTTYGSRADMQSGCGRRTGQGTRSGPVGGGAEVVSVFLGEHSEHALVGFDRITPWQLGVEALVLIETDEVKDVGAEDGEDAARVHLGVAVVADPHGRCAGGRRGLGACLSDRASVDHPERGIP